LDDTGDVYLADPTALPDNQGDYSIRVRATNNSGVSTERILLVKSVGREDNTAIDAIKVQQLSGRRLVFDMRATSVTAAGDRMLTTLEIDGKPLPIGATYSAQADGIVFGTYEAKPDGTLMFQLDPQAMQNPKLLKVNPENPGEQQVSLPPIKVLLVSESQNTKELKVLASRAYGDQNETTK